MRVYGALMWSIAKVINVPECPKAQYIYQESKLLAFLMPSYPMLCSTQTTAWTINDILGNIPFFVWGDIQCFEQFGMLLTEICFKKINAPVQDFKVHQPKQKGIPYFCEQFPPLNSFCSIYYIRVKLSRKLNRYAYENMYIIQLQTVNGNYSRTYGVCKM